MVKKKPAQTNQNDEFMYVMDLCRSAVNSGDEVMRHFVQRFLDYLVASGNDKKAGEIRRLLSSKARMLDLTPRRLVRSRAMPAVEELSKAVRPPIDKETASPLADIVWPEDLPAIAPILPRELSQLVNNFIKEWEHAEELGSAGVSPTRSLLVYGAPGTGKTHLALWIARQLNLPVVLARLDGMISSFLGTTSRNIGSLFDFAERYQCVLLLDEFDAVAKLRDDPHEMGEIKRVVNTILQRLDQRHESGLTIGITNHEQLLDPAVWRRFQVQIRMPSPTIEGKLAILRHYLSPFELELAEERFLAWLCSNMTGADIEAFVNSFKRLKVITRSDEPAFIELCRLTVDMHPDRVGEVQRSTLGQADAVAVKQLASNTEVGIDLQSLAAIFDRSRSTIGRWMNS